MESDSTFYISPSFHTHPSTDIDDIADIADRVVLELRTTNELNDDVFCLSDDDNPVDDINSEVNTSNRNNYAETVKKHEEIDSQKEDEHEFEFPVVCTNSNSSPISSNEIVSLRFPVFDRSLLAEIDFNLNNSVNSVNGVDLTETESKPVPSTRPSLRKLLSEDRDSISPSTSSSEAEELDGIAPGTYCVWKPKTEPRGKHKKSNSISIGNTSKRWKIRDLLKRSYSDDSYSSGKDSPVVVFIPPVSPNQKMSNEKVIKIEKSGKVGSAAGAGGGGVGGGVVYTKTEKNIPAYKSKVGNLRLPPYLPYRQDQVAAFANCNGSNPNLYRY